MGEALAADVAVIEPVWQRSHTKETTPEAVINALAALGLPRNSRPFQPIEENVAEPPQWREDAKTRTATTKATPQRHNDEKTKKEKRKMLPT